MRDVVLFILILVFSASAASFAPSSASIGATKEAKPEVTKQDVVVRTASLRDPDDQSKLKESLQEIEARCNSLETILQDIEPSLETRR